MNRSKTLKPLVYLTLAMGLLAGVSAWAAPPSNRQTGPTSQYRVPSGNRTGQTGAQQNTQQAAGDGSQKAGLAGMMSIAGGAMMIQQGYSSCPYPGSGCAMVAMGVLTMMQGFQGMEGSKKLGQMANQAGLRGADMGSVSASTTFGTELDKGNTAFSIDPSAIKGSKAGALFDAFQDKSGMSAEDLAAGLNNGASMKDLLKRMKFDEGNLNKALSMNPDAEAANMLDKLGMTDAELAKLAGIGENMAGGTGGGGFKSKAKGGSDSALDDLFAKKDEANGPGAGGSSVADSMGLSADVEQALGRAGLTDKSIFQMVHSRYRARTPGMFGVDQKKTIDVNDPFSNPAATKREPAAVALEGTEKGILD